MCSHFLGLVGFREGKCFELTVNHDYISEKPQSFVTESDSDVLCESSNHKSVDYQPWMDDSMAALSNARKTVLEPPADILQLQR